LNSEINGSLSQLTATRKRFAITKIQCSKQRHLFTKAGINFASGKSHVTPGHFEAFDV